MSDTFKAFVVTEEADGSYKRTVRQWPINKLPQHGVFIRVDYSSLNYKDALSASGNKGITKDYPHIPGIDAAGIVEESSSSQVTKGDKVIVTGYDLGQNTSGGFGRYIRVPVDWIVPQPKTLSLQESMILGTAGFTAALGVHHLKHNNIKPGDGPVLVTGATGGVGTLAIAILSKIGYSVTAATGKMDHQSFLEKIGAASVIHRAEAQDRSERPLLSGQWSGVIETVGGIMLDTAIRQTKRHGTVACCGNILGHELHTDIYPFILRGITLTGINSADTPMELRQQIWKNLATAWKPEHLGLLAKECNLDELNSEINKILQGRQSGRIMINQRS